MIDFGDYEKPFSEMFHAALRKGLDTRYSCLAWNYLHLCDNAVMVNFCNYVDEKLISSTADKLTGAVLAEACKSWHWDQRKPDSYRPLFDGDAGTHAKVLYGVMEFMPQEDYDALAETIHFWIHLD